MELVLLIK